MTTRHTGVRLVGVISDTHGLVRPQAVHALTGTDLIIHAGDIGSQEVLHAFAALAPLVAICGNNDREPWAACLPHTQTVDVNDLFIHVLHDVRDLNLNPRAAGFSAVIAGHSHKPSITHRDGVLFLNPGSAGPRRFSLPVAVAKVRVIDGGFHPEIVELEV